MEALRNRQASLVQAIISVPADQSAPVELAKLQAAYQQLEWVITYPDSRVRELRTRLMVEEVL